ncbi:MAG: CAP domain-containing protein [Candidatus Eisenbacteria bacterium]|nr:CAP domain-containing protein [Candidatus Eisenbacteria bacterium]
MSTTAHRAFALLLLAGLAAAGIPALRMDAGRAGAALHGEPAIADPEVRELVRLVNERRVRIGCPPLAWDARLARVAEKHSADMAGRRFFSHVNPDGDDSFDRIQDSMIEFHSAGENIAAGQGTAREVLAAWMKSRRHRANLENCLYTHHGIGRIQNRWTHVFVQLSATSP